MRLTHRDPAPPARSRSRRCWRCCPARRSSRSSAPTARSPTPTARPKARPAGRSTSRNTAARRAALPYELRQAASRYPVTLYTTAELRRPATPAATGCASAAFPSPRSRSRAPRTARPSSALSARRDCPTLTIGTQTVRGLAPSNGTRYLDAAGYPRDSQLPRDLQVRGGDAADRTTRRPPSRRRPRHREAPADARAPTATDAGQSRRHQVLSRGGLRRARRGASSIPMRRAGQLPAATAAPIIQNSAGRAERRADERRRAAASACSTG